VEHTDSLRKINFAEAKVYLNTDLKIILLNQNNYTEILDSNKNDSNKEGKELMRIGTVISAQIINK